MPGTKMITKCGVNGATGVLPLLALGFTVGCNKFVPMSAKPLFSRPNWVVLTCRLRYHNKPKTSTF
jgi:hypothetical protein